MRPLTAKSLQPSLRSQNDLSRKNLQQNSQPRVRPSTANSSINRVSKILCQKIQERPHSSKRTVIAKYSRLAHQSIDLTEMFRPKYASKNKLKSKPQKSFWSLTLASKLEAKSSTFLHCQENLNSVQKNSLPFNNQIIRSLNLQNGDQKTTFGVSGQNCMIPKAPESFIPYHHQNPNKKMQKYATEYRKIDDNTNYLKKRQNKFHLKKSNNQQNVEVFQRKNFKNSFCTSKSPAASMSFSTQNKNTLNTQKINCKKSDEIEEIHLQKWESHQSPLNLSTIAQH